MESESHFPRQPLERDAVYEAFNADLRLASEYVARYEELIHEVPDIDEKIEQAVEELNSRNPYCLQKVLYAGEGLVPVFENGIPQCDAIGVIEQSVGDYVEVEFLRVEQDDDTSSYGLYHKIYAGSIALRQFYTVYTQHAAFHYVSIDGMVRVVDEFEDIYVRERSQDMPQDDEVVEQLQIWNDSLQTMVRSESFCALDGLQQEQRLLAFSEKLNNHFNVRELMVSAYTGKAIVPIPGSREPVVMEMGKDGEVLNGHCLGLELLRMPIGETESYVSDVTLCLVIDPFDTTRDSIGLDESSVVFCPFSADEMMLQFYDPTEAS